MYGANFVSYSACQETNASVDRDANAMTMPFGRLRARREKFQSRILYGLLSWNSGTLFMTLMPSLAESEPFGSVTMRVFKREVNSTCVCELGCRVQLN